MRQMQIKAVIITDGSKYAIHGASDQTSQEMFRAMGPIWGFDPATETAHYVELEVTLPEFED